MAQAQPEFGLTLPILLLCCSEFLKRAFEIWRPWSINCDGRGPSRVLGGLSATRKQSSLTGCRLCAEVPAGVHFRDTGIWEMPNRRTSGIVGGSDITFRRH